MSLGGGISMLPHLPDLEHLVPGVCIELGTLFPVLPTTLYYRPETRDQCPTPAGSLGR